MAQYNLINNGILRALTAPGTGNRSLTWAELEALQDGALATGGVTISGADNLYLEADLSNRIKVDGIRLYMSDLTKLSKITFAYKNAAADSYTTLSGYVGSYYYTTIPDPSAPMYVRITISGVSAEAYEFQIFNEDYTVGFGSDGTTSTEYIEDTAVGEISTVTTIPLYNSRALQPPADAYVCIDYTGTDADEFVELSTSQNGTWYALADGGFVEDSATDSTYNWNMGQHSNTTVSGGVVVISAGNTVGTYTSPVFGLSNAYSSSYFVINGTTTSGTSSISYDAAVYNGTIRVRSSDTVPVITNEVFWLWGVAGSPGAGYIAKDIINNGSESNAWKSIGSVLITTRRPPTYTAVNRRTGEIYLSCGNASGFNTDTFYKYDNDGVLLVSKSDHYIYGFNVNMEIDKSGGVWGYGDDTINSRTLYHYDRTIGTALCSLSDSGSDFLYDLAVELDGDGVWYTDKSVDSLIHLDSGGTILATVVLPEPRAVCGTLDNGCWVCDDTNIQASRYTSGGVLSKTVTLGRAAARMTTDYEDGFWYLTSTGYLYHVTSAGVEDIGLLVGATMIRITPGYGGCLVWSDTDKTAKWVNKSTGAVSRTFDLSGSAYYTACPGVLPMSYTQEGVLKTNFLPASYDSTWSSLSWDEVGKDGYFLPKKVYHQVEVTLRRSTAGDISPSLDKIAMAPAIRVPDIQPQSSTNMYVRTNVPQNQSGIEHEARLKCWWGINS